MSGGLRVGLCQTSLQTDWSYPGHPAVVTSESLIHPSELTTYPLKSTHKLVNFSVSELAIALAEGKRY